MAEAPMTVVETEEFLRKVKPPMSDAEREDLVAFLGANPEVGKIVAETGGVRTVAAVPADRASEEREGEPHPG